MLKEEEFYSGGKKEREREKKIIVAINNISNELFNYSISSLRNNIFLIKFIKERRILFERKKKETRMNLFNYTMI